MADEKISALTELTTPAADDEFVVVDKSDTTMAASGTDKRITRENALPSFDVHSVIPGGEVDFAVSTSVGVANTYFGLRVLVLSYATLQGIRYKVGGTSNGNVRAALYDTGGQTRLANRTTNVAQSGAGGFQNVAFDSTYDAPPGTYLALLWFSSATSTSVSSIFSTVGATGTDATGPPTTVTVATANAYRPVMSTY